jgi:hypothetical protein
LYKDEIARRLNTLNQINMNEMWSEKSSYNIQR